MQTKIEKVIYTLFLFFLPVVSLGAGGEGPFDIPDVGPVSGSGPKTLASIAGRILDVVPTFSKLLLALALAYFLYGVFGFINAIDPKKKTEARDTIAYGIIGLFVMTSVWGLVNTVRSALGI